MRLIEQNNKHSIADLHIHTRYSDGQYDVEYIINQAANGYACDAIAITDHDSVEAVRKLDRNSPLIHARNIDIIDGIELSAKDPTNENLGTMHILGLGIDPFNEGLYQTTQELRQRNINVTLALLEILKNDFNLEFSDAEIRALINANRNLGRPEIAKLCIRRGYATSVPDAFKRYLVSANDMLGAGKKGIPYEDCLDLISKSGGVSVLAHPKSLELPEDKLSEMIRIMKDCGLRGIEAYHSTHSQEEVELYLELARKYDLLISGGSDYHGPDVKPGVYIGQAGGKLIKTRNLTVLGGIRR